MNEEGIKVSARPILVLTCFNRSWDVLRLALKLQQAFGIRWIMTSLLQHLNYVDDICLFAHKIPELSAMIKSLEVVAASASLRINCRKTKILSLTRNATGLVQVGGEQIEAVEKFTYIASGGESRIKLARSAFAVLSAI